MKQNHLRLLLIGVTVVSLALVALANPDPWLRDSICEVWCVRVDHAAYWNNMLYDLGISAVSSVAFYVLLVILPRT